MTAVGVLKELMCGSIQKLPFVKRYLYHDQCQSYQMPLSNLYVTLPIQDCRYVRCNTENLFYTHKGVLRCSNFDSPRNVSLHNELEQFNEIIHNTNGSISTQIGCVIRYGHTSIY